MPAPFLSLLDLLLQSVELRRGEELSQSDAETVAEEFDGQKLGILALAIEDILHAGGRQRPRCCGQPRCPDRSRRCHDRHHRVEQPQL